MKNQGISLIALIITIIVIIILAAIVIFTGLGTPESAQFSAFTNDVDTVYMAVMDKFADLKVQHTLSGDYRTNEQIYIEIAQGKAAADQYTVMNTDGTTAGSAANGIGNGDAGTGCINIQKDNTLLTVRLPKVREDENYWYILKDGRVFNETGYLYKSGDERSLAHLIESVLQNRDNSRLIAENGQRIWKLLNSQPRAAPSSGTCIPLSRPT